MKRASTAVSGPAPVDLSGETLFCRRVYAALCRVPAGRVVSYAGLARAAGCGSPRAVGQALRRNPFAPRVPCHRVIAADGTLGGFHGQTAGPELARKRRLLKGEGVLFDRAGRLLEPERLLRPGELPPAGD